MSKANRKNKVTATATAAEVAVTSTSKEKDVVIMSASQAKEVDEQKSISGKIRYLNSQKFSIGDIARLLTEHLNRKDHPVRYQHVRNVLTTPLKRSAAE